MHHTLDKRTAFNEIANVYSISSRNIFCKRPYNTETFVVSSVLPVSIYHHDYVGNVTRLNDSLSARK